MKATFRRFEENESVHPDLGPPNVFLHWRSSRNGPMATAPITKSKDKTQDPFCLQGKSPNQSEVETIHSLFENVQGKSCQD